MQINKWVGRTGQVIVGGIKESGTDYTSNLNQFIVDSRAVRQKAMKVAHNTKDTLAKMRSSGSIGRKFEDWFFQKGQQFGDADLNAGSDDDFDAGFHGFDNSDGDDSSSSPSVSTLDVSDMKQIARGQVGAMYGMFGQLSQANQANTAEIVSALNLRGSETITALNNISSILTTMSKKMDKLITTNQEADLRKESDLYDSKGNINLGAFTKAMGEALKDHPIFSAVMMAKDAASMGAISPEFLVSQLIDMSGIKDKKLDILGQKSIDEIGRAFNTAVGNSINDILTNVMDSDMFKNVFGNLNESKISKDYSIGSQYNTKPAVFDGMARWSLVSIIPEHLKGIREALTGQRYNVDVSTGKLITSGKMKDQFHSVGEAALGSTGMSWRSSDQRDQIIDTMKNTNGLNAEDEKYLSDAFSALNLSFVNWLHDDAGLQTLHMKYLHAGNTSRVEEAASLMHAKTGLSKSKCKEIICIILSRFENPKYRSEAQEFITSVKSNLERLRTAAQERGLIITDGSAAKYRGGLRQATSDHYILGDKARVDPVMKSEYERLKKAETEAKKKSSLGLDFRNNLEKAQDEMKKLLAANPTLEADLKAEKVSKVDVETAKFTQLDYMRGIYEVLNSGINVFQVGVAEKRPRKTPFKRHILKHLDSSSNDPKYDSTEHEGHEVEAKEGEKPKGFLGQMKSMFVDPIKSAFSGLIPEPLKERLSDFIKSSGMKDKFNEVKDRVKDSKIGGKLGALSDKVIGTKEVTNEDGTVTAAKPGFVGNIKNKVTGIGSNIINKAKNIALNTIDRFEGHGAKDDQKNVDSYRDKQDLSTHDQALVQAATAKMQAAITSGGTTDDFGDVMKSLDMMENQEMKRHMQRTMSSMMRRNEKKEDGKKSIFGKLLGGLFTGLKFVFGFIMTPVIAAIKGLGMILFKMLGPIKKLLGGVVNFFKNVGKSALKDFKSGVKDIGGGFASLGKMAIGGIKNKLYGKNVVYDSHGNRMDNLQMSEDGKTVRTENNDIYDPESLQVRREGGGLIDRARAKKNQILHGQGYYDEETGETHYDDTGLINKAKTKGTELLNRARYGKESSFYGESGRRQDNQGKAAGGIEGLGNRILHGRMDQNESGEDTGSRSGGLINRGKDFWYGKEKEVQTGYATETAEGTLGVDTFDTVREGGMKDKLKTLPGKAKDKVTDIYQTFLQGKDGKGGIKNLWGNFLHGKDGKGGLSGLWAKFIDSKLGNMFKTFFSKAGKVVTTVFSKVSGAVKNIFGKIADSKFGQTVAKGAGFVGDKLKSAGSWIKDKAKGAVDGMKDKFNEPGFGDRIRSGAAEFGQGVREGFTESMSTVDPLIQRPINPETGEKKGWLASIGDLFKDPEAEAKKKEEEEAKQQRLEEIERDKEVTDIITSPEPKGIFTRIIDLLDPQGKEERDAKRAEKEKAESEQKEADEKKAAEDKEKNKEKSMQDKAKDQQQAGKDQMKAGGGQLKDALKGGGGLKDIGKAVGQIAGGIGKMAIGMIKIQLLMAAAQVVMEGIQLIMDAVKDVLVQGMKPIAKIFTVLLKEIKPILKLLTDIIKLVAKSVADIVITLMKVIKPVLDIVTDLLGTIFEILGPILKMITSLLDFVMIPIMLILENIVVPILRTVGNSLQFIMGILQIGFGILQVALGGILTAIGFVVEVLTLGLVSGMRKSGVQMVKDGGKMVVDGGKTIADAVINQIQLMKDMFTLSVPEETPEYGPAEHKAEERDTNLGDVGMTGSGDTYNTYNNTYNTYRDSQNTSNINNANTSTSSSDIYNTYGAGDEMNQKKFGNYLNMKDRGCGPAVLADAYNRRLYGSGPVNAGQVATGMYRQGAYEPNRGTSVGNMIATGNAMGLGLRPGGVSQRSLSYASPRSPVTLLGSGSAFGTRRGNDHYVNVVGTRGNEAYVANPLTGKTSRQPIGSLVRGSRMGLYGSGNMEIPQGYNIYGGGDDDDNPHGLFRFDEETTGAFRKLKDTAAQLLDMFNFDKTTDEEIAEQRKKMEKKEKERNSALFLEQYNDLSSSEKEDVKILEVFLWWTDTVSETDQQILEVMGVWGIGPNDKYPIYQDPNPLVEMDPQNQKKYMPDSSAIRAANMKIVENAKGKLSKGKYDKNTGKRGSDTQILFWKRLALYNYFDQLMHYRETSNDTGRNFYEKAPQGKLEFNHVIQPKKNDEGNYVQTSIMNLKPNEAFWNKRSELPDFTTEEERNSYRGQAVGIYVAEVRKDTSEDKNIDASAGAADMEDQDEADISTAIRCNVCGRVLKRNLDGELFCPQWDCSFNDEGSSGPGTGNQYNGNNDMPSGEVRIVKQVDSPAEFANSGGKMDHKKIHDLLTDAVYNVSKDVAVPSTYHIDHNPSEREDAQIIEDYIGRRWSTKQKDFTESTSYQEFKDQLPDPNSIGIVGKYRPGVLETDKGLVAVAFHTNPHHSRQGGWNPDRSGANNVGPNIDTSYSANGVSISDPGQNWHKGHACIHFYDSTSGASSKGGRNPIIDFAHKWANMHPMYQRKYSCCDQHPTNKMYMITQDNAPGKKPSSGFNIGGIVNWGSNLFTDNDVMYEDTTITAYSKGQTVIIYNTKKIPGNGKCFGELPNEEWISMDCCELQMSNDGSDVLNPGDVNNPNYPNQPNQPGVVTPPSVPVMGGCGCHKIGKYTVNASNLHIHTGKGGSQTGSFLSRGTEVNITETSKGTIYRDVGDGADHDCWGKHSSGWSALDHMTYVGSSNSGSQTLSGNTNRERSRNFLRTIFPDVQAAAVMGSFGPESGFDPLTINPNDQPNPGTNWSVATPYTWRKWTGDTRTTVTAKDSIGLQQWNADRSKNLIDSYPGAYGELSSQLSFMKDEAPAQFMSGRDYTPNISGWSSAGNRGRYNLWMQINDPGEAGRVYRASVVRPANSSASRQWAIDEYKAMGNGDIFGSSDVRIPNFEIPNMIGSGDVSIPDYEIPEILTGNTNQQLQNQQGGPVISIDGVVAELRADQLEKILKNKFSVDDEKTHHLLALIIKRLEARQGMNITSQTQSESISLNDLFNEEIPAEYMQILT